MKCFSKNRRALHDYSIIRKLEVGLVLKGNEVKAVRAGNINLSASYAVISGTQLSLVNCHISSYSHAYTATLLSEDRSRILLAHRHEIKDLISDVQAKRLTLIPLSVYENNKGYIKVELAVCKHKKLHDRKEELRERDIERETRRDLKGSYDY